MADSTFYNSDQLMSYLQKKYGTYDPNAIQALRGRFWSSVAYPEAGVTSMNFFGTTYGASGQNLTLTNLAKANSFSPNSFWIKNIYCELLIKTWAIGTFTGLDANSLYADIINGFPWAGVLQLTVNQVVRLQLPKPMLYAPPADGQEQVYGSGVQSLTLTTGTPNTLATLVTAPPYGTLKQGRASAFAVDPNIFIEPDAPFQLTIGFPTGLVPVIGTDVTDDTTNPLYVRVTLDGVIFRPVG